jgi:hypothetical protein
VNYKQLLDHSFATMCELIPDAAESRLEYLAEYIFGFTTYDSEMSILFAQNAVEVCRAINTGETYEYTKNAEQYRWFLIMCNMLFFAERIDWGTSVRGAWWRYEQTLESNGFWVGKEQQLDVMTFDKQQWSDFVVALINFAQCETEHLTTPSPPG